MALLVILQIAELAALSAVAYYSIGCCLEQKRMVKSYIRFNERRSERLQRRIALLEAREKERAQVTLVKGEGRKTA